MAEILLDPSIRYWVFLPIVFINFLIGVVRQYVTLIVTREKKSVDLLSVSDSHVVMRSRMLRENGHCLPETAFAMRKYFFNNVENGFFRTQKRQKLDDAESSAAETLKRQLTNVLPMLFIGTFINYTFSGFLITKLPFPLTYRFKRMLQRGIKGLDSLDASWVSSASWYFLNVFGVRSMYSLLFGQNNQAQIRSVNETLLGSIDGRPNAKVNSIKLFRAEWEALELLKHSFSLAQADKQFVDAFCAMEL